MIPASICGRKIIDKFRITSTSLRTPILHRQNGSPSRSPRRYSGELGNFQLSHWRGFLRLRPKTRSDDEVFGLGEQWLIYPQYAFSRNFKDHGMIKLSTYLRQYRYAEIQRGILNDSQNTNISVESVILLTSRQTVLFKRG